MAAKPSQEESDSWAKRIKVKSATDIDPECIALCMAMNRLPGIETTDSCWGHGSHEFHIWFNAESLEALPDLIYWFAACHCGFGGWRIEAHTDCGKSPIYFLVAGPAGLQGCFEAGEIAQRINEDIEEPTEESEDA